MSQETNIDAATITRKFWEPKMAEMIEYLYSRRGFSSRKAARICARNFIETRVFLAMVTGIPDCQSDHDLWSKA